MPEICSSAWPKGPEERIWDALKDNHCEQVQESDIPKPILRILLLPLTWGKVATHRRFFRVDGRGASGHISYMLLPDDTTKYLTILSGGYWFFKRQPSWEAVKHMPPEEIEARVSEIIIKYMKISTPLVYFDVTSNISGIQGLDIAIEVFNWTALEYEDALAHTARRLWAMLVNGEVRRLENDTWVLDIQDKLFQFVQADAEKMVCYGRTYYSRSLPWVIRKTKRKTV